MTRKEHIAWLKAIKDSVSGGDEEFDNKRRESLDAGISALEQQTGEWIRTETIHKCYARDDTYTTWAYNCSVCGARPLAKYASDLADDELSNYCPNCGADMRGAEDE